jgi:DHA1 family bicyclomycin/chloramphenicol resistance-like MFS transporter
MIRCWHWVIFVALDVLGPVTGSAFAPLLPDMVGDLGTSEANGMLAIQLGMFAKALGQLSLGEMSDRFGRRPVLLVTLLVYTASLAGCGFVSSLWPFLVLRMVGGFCEGTALLPVAIARDVWDNEEQRAKSLALIIGLRPLMLMAAPAFGGTFGQAFGWRPLFWLEGSLVALTFIAIVFFLLETLQRKSTAGQPAVSFPQKVSKLLSSRLYVGLTGFLVLQFCTLMSFSVVSNFVFEEYYGMSPAEAGSVTALIAVSGVFGAIAYKVWAGLFPRYSVLQSLRCFLVPHTGMGTFMILAALVPLYQYGWGIFVLAISLFAFLSIMQGPPARSLRVQPFPEISGLAVGLGGLFETCIPTGVSFIASQTWSHDGTPMTALLVQGVAALLAVAWFLLVLGLRGAVWTPPQNLLAQAHAQNSEEANVDVEGRADAKGCADNNMEKLVVQAA